MFIFAHIALTFLAIYAIASLAHVKVDYRFLLIGSILPDLVDKPIGRLFFAGYFESGRIFGHTLLFAIALALLAVYLNRKYHIAGVIFLSVGCLMHVVEDAGIFNLRTLLWPLFGLSFSKSPMDDYWGHIINELLSDPFGIGLELFFGLSIVAIMTIYFKLYQKDRLRAFVSRGELRP
jgi:hypothetical protein